MDLDPFVPVGIQAQTTRFIDVFLLHCLLTDSPPDTPEEIKALGRNQHLTASRGREPGLSLERQGRPVPLTEWGLQIVEQCQPIAERLDALHGGSHYRDTVRAASALLRAPDGLPSAHVLKAMARDFDSSYARFTRAQSQATRDGLLAVPLAPELQARFARLAQASIEEQKKMESLDSLPFEIYRQQYVSADRLGVHHRAKAVVGAATR